MPFFGPVSILFIPASQTSCEKEPLNSSFQRYTLTSLPGQCSLYATKKGTSAKRHQQHS